MSKRGSKAGPTCHPKNTTVGAVVRTTAGKYIGAHGKVTRVSGDEMTVEYDGSVVVNARMDRYQLLKSGFPIIKTIDIQAVRRVDFLKNGQSDVRNGSIDVLNNVPNTQKMAGWH